jgi:demethoxyubiquinone hydroxylase (CLK1/Coq7/Cat5 family)
MELNFHNHFNDQLKELQEEEANLERYLYENINSLDNNEVLKIKNKIAGIRNTQEEVNEIITGAFF